MEEEQVNIKKVITKVDDDKSYSIDVDETTTFYEFKKILAAAAHLLKNCFRIFHEEQEYTNDYDDNTIKEMFPDLNPIPLRIVSNKEVYEYEDELISIKFNIQIPCDSHIGKYKMLYCFSCNKSICMDCFNQAHKGHKVEEKADYLAPAILLMNNIFSNSSLYKADSRLSKYMDCVSFRSNLKLNIFDNLRKLINELEMKFASCLEYFSTCEDETEKNTNENLELMKKYCIECFIKLKNDINTKGIIIDDEIFLTLYHKLKEIEKYKSEYFEENKTKYEKLNLLLAPFIKQVEKISEEIKITFDNYLNKDIYENFKLSIQENIVEKIQKEQINDLMFRNLGVPRKSLNRMSLAAVSNYKRVGRNTSFSPNRHLNNQKEEKNPFPRAIMQTPQNQGYSYDSSLGFNDKNAKQNYASYTYSKNGQQNINSFGLQPILENSTLVRRVEETVNTNVSNQKNKNIGVQGMKSILNNNVGPNNLNMDITAMTEMNRNTNINNLNNMTTSTTGTNNYGIVGNTQNLKKETTVYQTRETSYPVTTTNYTQKEIVEKITNNPNLSLDMQTQKNITKTQTTNTTVITKNLGEQNNALNSNMNVNVGTMGNMVKNYTQGYEVTQTTITSQNQVQHSGTQQAGTASNSMFGGKLVDVLNNAISENEREFQEKMKNQGVIKETHTEQLFGNDGNIIQRVITTETTEYGNALSESLFSFMFPIFNTNKIIGAMVDESTGKIEIDFKQAFGEKDIQLNEFPQGGAFCNSGKYLYVTGGQEKQKGIGKICLRVSVFKNDYSAKLVKMPSMINSHWNHSMIANDDYIFVIGGYNSNKCECFNFKTMKWQAMPDLNSEERQRPILAIYKDYLYVFMGYSQYNILDSVERININKLGKSKWEKVAFSNPDSINLKFYGAACFNLNGNLFFIGGKFGKGNDDDDYKTEIYCFNFNKMQFSATDVYYSGQLSFIETQFHICNESNIGNFIDSNEGTLATIAISSLNESNIK